MVSPGSWLCHGAWNKMLGVVAMCGRRPVRKEPALDVASSQAFCRLWEVGVGRDFPTSTFGSPGWERRWEGRKQRKAYEAPLRSRQGGRFSHMNVNSPHSPRMTFEEALSRAELASSLTVGPWVRHSSYLSHGMGVEPALFTSVLERTKAARVLTE